VPGTGWPEPGGCAARGLEVAELMWRHVPVCGLELVEVSPLRHQRHDLTDGYTGVISM